jgi:putative transcriptional regulator
MDEQMFAELVKSTQEAKEILNKSTNPSRRFYIKEPDAKAIRKKFHLTQNEFANLLNISVGTLRNWEQGRRKPEGPARVLLHVVDTHPDVLMAL